MPNEQVDAQVKALSEKLAEREKDCPTCKGQGGWVKPDDQYGPGETTVCPTCDGSVKVARYPGARVVCPHCLGRKQVTFLLRVEVEGPKFGFEECFVCHGKGYVANTDMEVWLLEALQGGDVEFKAAPGCVGNTEVVFRRFHNPQPITVVAGSAFLGLLAALEQVPHA